jgi:hypothetical protein
MTRSTSGADPKQAACKASDRSAHNDIIWIRRLFEHTTRLKVLIFPRLFGEGIPSWVVFTVQHFIPSPYSRTTTRTEPRQTRLHG